jgi:hypothetical protein
MLAGSGRRHISYEATEYSPRRREIYRSARYFVDIDSLLLEAAQERFVGFLLGLIAAGAVAGAAARDELK